MSNMLIPVNEIMQGGELAQFMETSEEDFASLALAAGGFSYVQLMQSQTKLAQENPDQFRAGDFVLTVNRENINLGKEFLFIPITSRFKAVDTRTKPPKTYYDPKDPAFQEVKARSDLAGLNDAMAGNDFLIYLTDYDEFASLFCANKSFRTQAGIIRGRAGKHTKMKSGLVDNGKNRWQAPTVMDAAEEPRHYPPGHAEGNYAKIQEMIKRFHNPATAEELAGGKKVEESASDSVAR